MFPIFDWAGVFSVGTKYRSEKSGFDIRYLQDEETPEEGTDGTEQ
jgi:hypothetical protein